MHSKHFESPGHFWNCLSSWKFLCLCGTNIWDTKTLEISCVPLFLAYPSLFYFYFFQRPIFTSTLKIELNPYSIYKIIPWQQILSLNLSNLTLTGTIATLVGKSKLNPLFSEPCCGFGCGQQFYNAWTICNFICPE